MTAYTLVADCPVCGSDLLVRYRRRDRSRFIGCSAYPDCDYTAPFDDVIQRLGARAAQAHGHVDADVLAAQVETACRRLLQVVHPDKLIAHPTEAHEATLIILALRKETKNLPDR